MLAVKLLGFNVLNLFIHLRIIRICLFSVNNFHHDTIVTVQPNITSYIAIVTCATVADVVEPPTNVRTTVLTPRSVKVTWTISPSFGVTGYLISYTGNHNFASNGSVTVSGGSIRSFTLTGLEEDTPYTITVQATASDNRMSANSNEVSVRTYTDGK